MNNWQLYLSEQRESNLNDLLNFLRIPSISSLPEHAKDVERAAEWVAARMQKAGLEQVSVLATGNHTTAGHPVVYGQWLNAPGKPTVLVYGHFDTQPVDPLDLWDAPPFEPTLKDGRITARGASDDKGNMLIPILAVEALLNSEDSLPVNIKFMFEGQEEIGSPQLPDFINNYKDLLGCDIVLSADGAQWTEDQPALWVGLKGICALQINVTGANTDLHSGGYGGAVQNPLHALTHLLASMRGADGKILVEGFYDDVKPLTDEDREQIAAVPFDEDEYKEKLGIKEVFGEAGYTTLERSWARPTLELNGIYGGFQGQGVKTVLPNAAHAKITCRLVADQDPKRTIELITRHVNQHTLPGVTSEVVAEGSSSRAYLMPTDHPGNQAAAEVHREVYGVSPYFVRAGGSIPFCSLILEALGVYTVNFAFGLRDERAHAPNEFFRISSFEKGQRAYCLLLEKLGTMTADELKETR